MVFVLLGLLGIGAAALAFDLFDSNDDDAEAETETEDGQVQNGTEGDDDLTGGRGDDLLRGGPGEDILSGGAGDDRIFGEEDSDVVLGNAGDDFLRGGAGDDVLADSQGADTLRGDTGDDLIVATGISDPAALLAAARAGGISAFDGNPEDAGFDFTRETDTEGDVLDGGRGADTLIFGQGDTVTGGEGFDFFVAGETITAGSPAVITDFEVNEETLLITTDGPDTPDLEVIEQGDDAVLTLNGQAAVIVKGLAGVFSLSDVDVLDLGTL